MVTSITGKTLFSDIGPPQTMSLTGLAGRGQSAGSAMGNTDQVERLQQQGRHAAATATAADVMGARWEVDASTRRVVQGNVKVNK